MHALVDCDHHVQKFPLFQRIHLSIQVVGLPIPADVMLWTPKVITASLHDDFVVSDIGA